MDAAVESGRHQVPEMRGVRCLSTLNTNRFSPGVENGRDGTVAPVSRDQILRRERSQGKTVFSMFIS